MTVELATQDTRDVHLTSLPGISATSIYFGTHTMLRMPEEVLIRMSFGNLDWNLFDYRPPNKVTSEVAYHEF